MRCVPFYDEGVRVIGTTPPPCGHSCATRATSSGSSRVHPFRGSSSETPDAWWRASHVSTGRLTPPPRPERPVCPCEPRTTNDGSPARPRVHALTAACPRRGAPWREQAQGRFWRTVPPSWGVGHKGAPATTLTALELAPHLLSRCHSLLPCAASRRRRPSRCGVSTHYRLFNMHAPRASPREAVAFSARPQWLALRWSLR